MEKLLIVTRRDLSPGQQAVQSTHAAIEFAFQHGEIARRWFIDSNHLALLNVENEEELVKLIEKAEDRNFKYSFFREPDRNNEITAIALEPLARRIVSGLPLTLARLTGIEPACLDLESRA